MRRPPSRPAARRRPRWLTVVFKSLIVLLALAVVATGAGYVYLRAQLGKIKRVNIPALVEDEPGKVMNVLLVGSDSRATATGDVADATGKSVEGDRTGLSDTMMVLHIEPRTGTAAILSIPRDLYLPIQPSGEKDRINSAFADGGPSELIQTIQVSLGIQVNHYAEVDLEGFKNIVDTLGGLKIFLDAPARDLKSGLDLPDPGCVQLDGFQALAYVRSRYYESYEAGSWSSDGTSDFGRIKRQQDFIRRMMRKAVSQGLTNPLTLNRLISIGVSNLTIDSTMSTKDMVTLARRFKSLDPNTVDMQTLPTTRYITPGGADVQLLDKAAAQPLIDKINGKAVAPQTVQPADVQVRVLNGFGGDQAASKAGSALHDVGFEVSGTADADSFSYTETVIRYLPSSAAKAHLLQTYVSGPTQLVEDSNLGTADVALVLGANFSGIRSTPAAGSTPPAPTTTAAVPNPQPNARGATQPAC